MKNKSIKNLLYVLSKYNESRKIIEDIINEQYDIKLPNSIMQILLKEYKSDFLNSYIILRNPEDFMDYLFGKRVTIYEKDEQYILKSEMIEECTSFTDAPITFGQITSDQILICGLVDKINEKGKERKIKLEMRSGDMYFEIPTTNPKADITKEYVIKVRSEIWETYYTTDNNTIYNFSFQDIEYENTFIVYLPDDEELAKYKSKKRAKKIKSKKLGI